MSNAAIYFHEDAFLTSGERLLGRHSAGEGFLTGFLRHARIDHLYGFTEQERGEQGFRAVCEALGGRNAALPATVIRSLSDPALAAAGTLMMPGPGLDAMAWRRRRGDQRAFSLCGLTHTTSSKAAMDAIGALTLAPVQDWDAVICTSRAVRAMVATQMERQQDYLAARLGAGRFPLPQLPVIPLGADTQRLDPDTPGAQASRADWRRRLGIAEEDVAVLFMGRLSFHAKAHPLPMYVALEEAAQQLSGAMPGRRLHLIQAGWFANAGIESAFKDGAAALAPSVNAIWLDGRDPDLRFSVWFAADLFCSLSDNIQETFGLTPVEAMAAGLPAVVSDWDGYRDTVPDGLAGIRVPTLAPPPGPLEILAWRHDDNVDSYDRYCGHSCLSTAVDISAARDAFIGLIREPERRRNMGRAAREHAVRSFDWGVVVHAYQDLWGELAARRAAAAEVAPRGAGPANPLRADPFDLFASYPTAAFDRDTVLERDPARPDSYARVVSALAFNSFGGRLVGANQPAQTVLNRVGRGSSTVGAIVDACDPQDHPRIWMAVGWLLKMGLLRVRRA